MTQINNEYQNFILFLTRKMKFNPVTKILLIFSYFSIATLAQFIKLRGRQNQDPNQFQHHHSCIEFQQSIIYVQSSSFDNIRLLQTENKLFLRGFRITTEFLESSGTQSSQLLPKVQIIKRLLKISSKFFQVVLKVKQQRKSDTLYRGTKCGDLIVPLKYRNSGFQPNETDLLIFITTSKDKDTVTKAYSSTCQFVQRPNYGQINYNIQRMNQKYTNYEFHRQILVTLHQIMHVLVFNTLFFLPENQKSRFYISPQSNINRKISNVIMQNPDDKDTYMIITPKVKQYVQQYYGCSQNIGGLLAFMNNTILKNSTLKTLPGSHWEQSIVFDQFMMPNSYPALGKISKLTLLLMEDSGFFDFVDVQMHQKTTFGKGKGCQFAKGVKKNQSLQYCNNSDQKTPSCDFYNTYAGGCHDNLRRGAGDGLCQDPKQRKFSVYEENSRCIDLTQNNRNTFLCTRAECVNGKIEIKIADQKVFCVPGQRQLFIKDYNVTVHCPKNFDVFCGVSFCEEWCGKQGICLDGKCLLVDCSNKNDYQCDKCFKHNNGSFECVSKGVSSWIQQSQPKQQIKAMLQIGPKYQAKQTQQIEQIQQNTSKSFKISMKTQVTQKLPSNCPINCLQCQESGKCVKCQQTYGIDTHQTNCVKCSDKKCKTCKIFAFYCVQCFQGRPDPRGICVR